MTTTPSVPYSFANKLSIAATSLLSVTATFGCERSTSESSSKFQRVSANSEQDPAPLVESFALSVPDGTSIADLMMSATSRLTIDDRTTLGEAEKLATVASGGPATTEFGASIEGHVNVVSQGDVDFLRSNAHVFGGVTTSGEIRLQNDVRIDGARLTGVSLSSSDIEWDVEWPVNDLTNFSHPPDAANVDFAPGAYDEVQVYSRATLTLNSGNYLINSLMVEPEARFRMDTSGGPINIYVRDKLVLRAELEFEEQEHEQVLFAYLGTESALFGAALEAAVIAPNSAIELRRPNTGGVHKGSFFGKSVQVFSDSTVQHVPLDLSFLCSANALARSLPESRDARDGNFYCPTALREQLGAPKVACLSATDAPEFIELTPSAGNESTLYFGGAGDDILLQEVSGTVALGGDGDDIMCGLSEGASALLAGKGNDKLQLAGESIEAIPGAGRDDVTIIDGHAEIWIKNACELIAGEKYRLLDGSATIHSPLSREQMLARGVEIDPQIVVKHSRSSVCEASCASPPLCEADEFCSDRNDEAVCLKRHPTFENSVPVDERYSELDPTTRDALRSHVDAIARGQSGVAPFELRWKSPVVVEALLKSIMKHSRYDRAPEIYALGSLYRPEALAAVEQVALIHAPKGLIGEHLDNGSDWFVGQQNAVLWLMTAAHRLKDGSAYVDALLRVVAGADDHTQELAVQALQELDSSLQMRSRIGAALPPEDAYMLNLEFN